MRECDCFCFCLFVLCYLQTFQCSEKLYGDDSDLKSFVNVKELLSTNSQSLHLLNLIRECLKLVNAKTIPVDSVTSHSDHKRKVQIQYDFANGLEIPIRCRLVLGSSFGLATNNLLFKSSAYERQNGLLANGPNQNIGEYDVALGIDRLCINDDQCSDPKSSFCSAAKEGNLYGNCLCKLGYVDDGEKCIEEGDINFCSTHDDCGGIEKGKCVYHITTNRRNCMCERNFVAANHQCLPRVQYLGDCVSSNQCSMNMQCLGNICRHGCNDGYSWKYDTCVKDLPDTKPDNKKGNVSFIWQVIAPISIISGVTVMALIIALVIILRRRFLERSDSFHSNTPENERAESMSSTTVSSHYDPMYDQPPSYNEVMTNSTLTLIPNTEDIAEEPPPSYKSWEENYSDKSVFKR